MFISRLSRGNIYFSNQCFSNLMASNKGYGSYEEIQKQWDMWFVYYYSFLVLCSSYLLSQELPVGLTAMCEAGSRPENKVKNRYLNIRACK